MRKRGISWQRLPQPGSQNYSMHSRWAIFFSIWVKLIWIYIHYLHALWWTISLLILHCRDLYQKMNSFMDYFRYPSDVISCKLISQFCLLSIRPFKCRMTSNFTWWWNSTLVEICCLCWIGMMAPSRRTWHAFIWQKSPWLYMTYTPWVMCTGMFLWRQLYYCRFSYL